MRSKIIKIIALILVAAFMAQNVAWASPREGSGVSSRSALGVPTIFQGISGATDKKILEVTFKYILQVVGRDGIRKLQYKLTPEIAGTRLELNFDKKRKGQNDMLIVPCTVSGTKSYHRFIALIGARGNIYIKKPEYFKIGDLPIAAGPRFEIPHMGLWEPFYDKAGNKFIIAHVKRRNSGITVLPDYFVLRMDIRPASSLESERFLYYPHKDAQPVRIIIPSALEKQLDAAFSLDKLKGFIKSMMAGARLIFYFDRLLIRQHGRFSALLTDPDKSDARAIMAMARLVLPELDSDEYLLFERHEPWAHIADLTVLDKKNKNALIAEFGNHETSVQASKITASLLDFLKLNPAKGKETLSLPKQITLYADGIVADKKANHHFTQEQWDAINELIKTCHKWDVSDTTMRVFLKNVQIIINNIAAGLPQKEKTISRLPNRFVYIIDNAIDTGEESGEKHAVVLTFRKKDNNRYVIESKGFKILPRFANAQELLENYSDTLRIINDLYQQKEFGHFLNILSRRVKLFKKMWAALMESSPENRELAYKRTLKCLKDIRSFVDTAYHSKVLNKNQMTALLHPFKGYLSVFYMIDQEKDKIFQELKSGEDGKRIKLITNTIGIVEERIKEYAKFRRIAYTLSDAGPILNVEASKAEPAAPTTQERSSSTEKDYGETEITIAPEDKDEPAQFLRDIVNPEELTQNMIEGILSALFSNKKLTLAFNKKLKGLESAQLRALVRQLRQWKESTAKKNKRMKALLDNFTVLEYDDLKAALDGKNIDANAPDGLIFTYTPKPKDESQNPANIGSAIKPVYIIEKKGSFPANYYYPLLEMVTVSLAKELLHWDESQLREALVASNITVDTFGIDTAIDEKLGIIIFKVLPKMERYENNGRIDRYTRLLQFLHSA